MTKPIILTQGQWVTIRKELQTEHPKSTFMLRSRMRDKLGFTPRDHREYVPNLKFAEQMASARMLATVSKGYTIEQVHLDFFSEKKRTMFLMKFSEIINAPSADRVVL